MGGWIHMSDLLPLNPLSHFRISTEVPKVYGHFQFKKRTEYFLNYLTDITWRNQDILNLPENFKNSVYTCISIFELCLFLIL